MKKIVFILIVAVFLLSGCHLGGNNPTSSSANSSAPLGGTASGQSAELSDYCSEQVYENTEYTASFLISETFINSDNFRFGFNAAPNYKLDDLKLDIEYYIQENGEASTDYYYSDVLNYMTGINNDGDISTICIYGEKSDYCFQLLLETNGTFSEQDLDIIVGTLESFEFEVLSNNSDGPLSVPSGPSDAFAESTNFVAYDLGDIYYSFDLSKSFEFAEYNDYNGMVFYSDDTVFSLEILCFNGGYTSLDHFYDYTSYHTWPAPDDKGEFYDNNGRLVRYYLLSYNPSSYDGIYQLEFVDHGCGYVIFLKAKMDIPQYAVNYMNDLVNNSDNFLTVVTNTNDNDIGNNNNNSLPDNDIYMPEIPSDAISVEGTNAYFYYPHGMGGFDEEITVSGLSFSEQTAGAQIAVFSNATLPSFAGSDFDYEADRYYQTISSQSSADVLYSGYDQINGMDAFYICYALDEGSFYSYHADFIIDSYMGSNPVFLAQISTSIDYFFDSDYDVLANLAYYFYPIY